MPLSGGRGGDGQEGVSHHRECDVPVPGDVAADLVLVQANLTLDGLEAFLDGPPAASYPDQLLVVGVGGAVAKVGDPPRSDATLSFLPLVQADRPE